MLHILRLLFKRDAKNISKEPSDENRYVVDIQLGYIKHTFYQEARFIDSVTSAIKNAPDFFEYKTHNGGYIINTACIDFMRIRDDVHKSSSDDPSGYSVYLAGKEKSFELGKLDLTFDQVAEMLVSKSDQFIRLGSYYFNRDDIALVVAYKN